MPVPFNVRALVLVIALPLRSSTAPLVTETVEAEPPNAAALPTFRVPAEIVEPPVKVLAPESVQIPVPDLVMADAPEVVGLPKTGVKAPSAEPVKVKVGDVAAVVPSEPTLLKVSAPAPEESIVAPFAPTVNKRFTLTAAPVYLSVPPLMTKFAAVALAAPILL